MNARSQFQLRRGSAPPTTILFLASPISVLGIRRRLWTCALGDPQLA
jgi:hypothetical protein